MSETMDETFGAMFIGGVLTIQGYIYYEHFPNDPVRILDVVHLVLVSQACYHYLITSWGDGSALLVTTLPLDLHLIVSGLATACCQGFFLYRIWSFSNKNWILTGALASACLTTFGLGIFISVQLILAKSVAAFNTFTAVVDANFIIGAIVDLIIALILVYYLREGRGHFERTHLAVATGLATSLLGVAIVIAYHLRPNSFIYIAIHYSLARMYTNALLASLNSRKGARRLLSGYTPSTLSAAQFVLTVREEYGLQHVKSPV
ncbi:hypothetical protein DFH09DRAFT_1199524 [Mycena vulgaris]|nr:hypothetical protein DFH09DRAFT_1215410 [Mycena vulgaris]KAJ6507667.1 hypothetical protein DFH09DRAFT_1199524 [Mycena vulgaris]